MSQTTTRYTVTLVGRFEFEIEASSEEAALEIARHGIPIDFMEDEIEVFELD